MLCFTFYEEVYYWERDAPFPASHEKKGYFVGIEESKGDALTFTILTADTEELITRSVVRPVDPDNLNQRADMARGEVAPSE